MKCEVFVMTRVFVDRPDVVDAPEAALDAVRRGTDEVIDSKVIHLRQLDDSAEIEDYV